MRDLPGARSTTLPVAEPVVRYPVFKTGQVTISAAPHVSCAVGCPFILVDTAAVGAIEAADKMQVANLHRGLGFACID
jgi:hypothetical protein